jgi:hypothetical protein
MMLGLRPMKGQLSAYSARFLVSHVRRLKFPIDHVEVIKLVCPNEPARGIETLQRNRRSKLLH